MSRERNVVVLASRAAEMSDSAQKSLQNAAICINAAAVELRQCAHACDKFVKAVELAAAEAQERSAGYRSARLCQRARIWPSWDSRNNFATSAHAQLLPE